MNLKPQLLSSGAFGGMTANEQRLGRFIRDGEGHPAPAAPAPSAEPAAPAPSADPAPTGEDDFESFERSLDNKGEVDPPAPAPTGEDKVDPPAPEDTGVPKEPGEDDPVAAEKQRADAAEARAAELERQLAEAGKPKAPETKAPQSGDEDAAPDPQNYEFGEADSKFIADSARWHARQEFQAQQSAAEFRQQVAQVEDNWKAAVSTPEMAEKYPDFEDKVTKGAASESWTCSPMMALLIKSSAQGPDVAYHLASNPAESRAIAELSPMEQALAIGRLEGRYSSEVAPKPQGKTVSEAPEPPQARSRGAGGQFATQADTNDFAAFDKFADGVLNKKK